MPRAFFIFLVPLLVLSACTSEPPTATPDPTGTPGTDTCTAPGAVSDSVRVTGEAGKAPKIEFDAPLTPELTERTVVTAGDGQEIPIGAVVTLDYTLLNGRTGDTIETTEYTETGSAAFILTPAGALMPALQKTIFCSEAGSRVVGVATSEDGFGDAGASEFGIEPGDSLVFVADIISWATRANGVPQDEPEGFPTVELAEDGAPTVTIPDGYQPPSETQFATLIEGDGRTVENSDLVYLHYYGVDAASGEVFDQSWGANPMQTSATGLIPGFVQALVGQKVGSQFIVVTPPGDAYGELSETNTHQLAGKTLLFVVDVLAAMPGI